jgi:phenylacetate-CoA ligase
LDDFKNLPTVTKNDIIENQNDCIVEPRRHEKNLRVSRSSGSSGQILEIIAGTDRWVQSALLMLRMYQRALHFGPFDRGALIYTSQYPFQSAWGLYPVKYLYTLTPPSELISGLERIRPSYTISYPSILAELAALYPDRCNSLGVSGIATNSEHSTQAQRDHLSEIFAAPVFDEYSSEELILGGFQCEAGEYHLQEDCAYLEILETRSPQEVAPGATGEIVGTSLVHKVMPFIRYRQGDLAAITPSMCICGSSFRILGHIGGRRNASFQLRGGHTVPSGRILDWTYKLVLDFHLPIAQFQVIQHELHRMEVVIVTSTSADLTAPQHNVIMESFQTLFEASMDVEVRRVGTIPRTSAGKHMPIVSHVT